MQLVDTTDRAAVGDLITDEDARRRHRAARRQGPDRARRARSARAGDQAPRRRVPRLHRRPRRRRQAIRIADNAKTQRYSPCNTMETLLVARGHRRAGAAAAGRDLRDEGRRDARRRARARAGAGDEARDRGRLVRRVPGADPRDPRRRLARRGDRAHRAVRLAAHRRHRHRGLRATRCASCAKSIRAR